MLLRVSDLDARVGMARGVAGSVFVKATDRLAEGADVERIHARFVVGAFALLEEVELRAVLASAGDREALGRIDQLVKDLESLRAELEEADYG